MKVSLNWLKDYVDIRLAPKELAQRLTMAGLEIKSVQAAGGNWDNVVIGEVIALRPHPNAERLKLATVNIGSGEVTVICGAPNVSPGQKVPFAPVGAQLVDVHTGKTMKLTPAKIRGIISEGMICSEKELGISDSHEGIMVLSPEAPVGMPLSEYLGDSILDLEVTPNRPDCLSLIGVAREIAVLTGRKLHLSQIVYEETEAPIPSFISVVIAEPDLCPRYCASLITGVKISPSPGWLQKRLGDYGMRPINNVVDVTNYVMLEYGQPLHAFDYHMLKGRQIIVRRSKNGETIFTLDGLERTLNQDILVIADKEKAVAVAGIMGGSGTEVTEETTAILLESANFGQAAIRQGCRYLNLQSEASIRFDKGLNPDLPLLPLKRATQLLLELAGGKAARGIIDVYPAKSEAKGISLFVEQVKRLSGLEVTVGEILRVLNSLGFECQGTDSASRISVIVPYWRSDIKCPADLVEEVVRIIGYDRIPLTRLGSPLPQQDSKFSLRAEQLSSSKIRRVFGFESDLKPRVRHILTGIGFQEILTYSLTSLEKLERLSPKSELKVTPLKVANPMSREQEYLRTTLRPGLLTSLAHNRKFEPEGIRLFEIGKVFLPQGRELPREREMLCAVLSGPRAELSWHGDKELLDFFDAKGVIENILGEFGLKAGFAASSDETMFPGREADVIVNSDELGILGELHPKVAQNFEITGPVCLVELDLDQLLTKVTEVKVYQAIPRFPGVSRDIALVVDEQLTYKEVEQLVQSFPLVTQVTLFDLYRGKQIPSDKKSFALSIIYQSYSHTLTDEEVDRTQEQILEKLNRKLGATLRS